MNEINAVYQWFFAKVVDVVNDPEQSGRAKIRIFGYHDDTTSIPDADLPWARPMFPVTNPSHGGVAGQQTGLMKDSVVCGFWVDADRQHPFVAFSMAAGGPPINIPVGSTPPPADILGSTRAVDTAQPINQSVIAAGAAEIAHAELPTIAGLDPSSLLDQIRSVDPGNISGSIPTAVAGVKSILNTTGVINNIKCLIGHADGLGDMVSQLTSSVSGIIAAGQGTVDNLGSLANRLIDQLDLPTDLTPEMKSSLTESLKGINVAGLSPAEIENKIKSVVGSSLGSVFGNVDGLILDLGSAQGILSSLGSFSFMQNKVIKNIESAFSILKSGGPKC